MLGLLLALVSAVFAVQTHTAAGGGVRVETTYAWPERLGQGFYPVTVEIENTASEPREITVRLDQVYGYYSSVERVVEVGGGERAELELLFPSFTDQTSTASVFVGERGAHLATVGQVGPTDQSPVAYRQYLLVGPEALELEDELPWIERLALNDHLSIGTAAFEHLPSEHVAFTSVDVVLLDLREELPTGPELDGLLAWVRLGGSLLIVGNPQGAAAHPQLEPWLQERFLWSAYVDNGMMPGVQTWTMGRGTVAFLPPEDLEHSLVLRSRMQQATEAPLTRLLPAGSGTHNPGFVPRIPGVDALPRGLFAILVLIVAFLLGPVNAFLVRFVLKRPALALVTTPVLALGSTGTMVGVGIAHNGLGVRAARATVTMLDQRDHRAAVHEVRQLYAGLSPGAGMRPSAGAWAFPTDMDWDFQYNSSWDEGRVVSGDMLPVRVPIGHVVIAERAARQRLDVDGQTVSNSLGATVEELVLQMDGTTWRIEGPLASGASAPLIEVADSEAQLERLWASTMATSDVSWPPKGHGLPEASYVVRLDSSPFVETEGLQIREDVGEHWVIGVLESAEDSP